MPDTRPPALASGTCGPLVPGNAFILRTSQQISRRLHKPFVRAGVDNRRIPARRKSVCSKWLNAIVFRGTAPLSKYRFEVADR
jgi:hypothetical protein